MHRSRTHAHIVGHNELGTCVSQAVRRAAHPHSLQCGAIQHHGLIPAVCEDLFAAVDVPDVLAVVVEVGVCDEGVSVTTHSRGFDRSQPQHYLVNAPVRIVITMQHIFGV